MDRIAIKMLLGDRAKYLGLIFGVAFATVLMSQQASLFIGVMARSASSIYNVPEAEVWVMDPRVRYIDEVEPMRDIELLNVRSVPGVEWAVPFHIGLSMARLSDNVTQQVQLIGVDDVSLIGLCHNLALGDINNIRIPDSAFLDVDGHHYMWGAQKLQLDRQLEVNDRRLVIRGLCDALPAFLSFPILYVPYEQSRIINAGARNNLSFVLVKAAKGTSAEELATRIHQQTGLQALTQHDFAWRSIDYMLERTGVAINFAITILLGVIVGAAITAQTFYIFVSENLTQFAAMKAIGFTNRQLLRLVLVQAALVTAVGFGIGIGFTNLFFVVTADMPVLRGFMLYWQVVVISAVVILMIVLGSIFYSLRRVFALDPAIVFRG